MPLPRAATTRVPSDQRLRLISYQAAAGAVVTVGAVTPDGMIIDVSARSMRDLIEAGPPALAQVRALVSARTATRADGHHLSDVLVCAPILTLQRTIYAVSDNYNVAACRSVLSGEGAQPMFFTKSAGTLTGPFDPIPTNPALSSALDWECVLAVVIGKRGVDIAEADALDHVFGYTVMNDITARDLHGFKAKSLDRHTPIGPWIVPADEVDPGDLRLLLRVNGVVKQDASTRQMVMSVARIIAELSRGMTLMPGDIIATGTPPGTGHVRVPPEFLKPGDVMESEIVGLGTLRTMIGEMTS